MKILVSDFDGTFYFNSLNINNNIDQILWLMDGGNKFIIATARSYNGIKPLIDKHSIPFDYLVCLEGASTFNANDELMFDYSFNIEEKKLIDGILDKYKYPKVVVLYSAYDWHDIKNPICGYQISSINPKALTILRNKITQELPHLSLKNNGIFRLIISKYPINKSFAINQINQELNVEKSNIFTIGNYLNDLEMIRDYNGFTMLLHHCKLNKYSLGHYLSVGNLAKDIMEEKVRTRTK